MSKGAPVPPTGDHLVTSSLAAALALALAATNPLGFALPALRHLHLVIYGGVILLSLACQSSVLRDRLLHAPRNWARFPLRSTLESALWLVLVHAVQRLVLSTPGGSALCALVGCVVCYAGDEVTRLLERARLARVAKTFDTQRGFFADGSALAPAGVRAVSLAEVRKHAAPGDCWIIVDGAVLDVSSWAPQHPGGALIINSLGGRDASDQYKAFHGTSMGGRLRAMVVGRLDVATAEAESETQASFRALHESLRARGEFSHPLHRTLVPMVLPLALMGCACAAMAVASGEGAGAPVATSALAGVLAGFAWQQMSLFGHDLGHGNVTGYFADDTAIGIALMPFFGIGISWWKATHNTHHVLTNSESHDPDIQHMPVFAVSPKMLRGFYSYYHAKVFRFDRLSRFLLARQHVLYYPIMAVAKVNLYVQTHLYLALHAVATSTLETLAMLAHYSAIAGALACLPSWPARAACFFCALAAAGLLHVQITLSHFPMKTHEGVAYKDGDESWWHMQLAGTVDVDCPPALDWLHGGLQYQTIHHLFPRLPRYALRGVSAEVAAVSAKAGVTYNRTSFAGGNLLVLDTLRKTADKCAAAPLADGPGAPRLWDALNARG